MSKSSSASPAPIGKMTLVAAAVATLPLMGCATSGPPGSEVNDPYEKVNRQVHQFNKTFDKAVFRPASVGYGTVVPGYVRQKVNNVQYNLQLPAEIINSLLQGRIENFGHNTFRFMLNSTLGVLGIFDPATSFGLERRDTDFGETLYVWGVGEGAYVEVPFFGPYTQRDLAGDIVDVVMNPLSVLGTDIPTYVPAGTYVLEAGDYRYRYKGTVDSVLYDSADSYAQTRVIYLDNRRYTLARAAQGRGDQDVTDPNGGGLVDPYADAYAEAASPIAQADARADRQRAASATIDPYEELNGE